MERHTYYRYIELIIMAVNNYNEHLPLTDTENKIIDMLEENDYIFEEWFKEEEIENYELEDIMRYIND